MKQKIESFQAALLSLDRVQADAIFKKALSEHSPIKVVEQIVVPALANIGQQWHDGKLALSQIYMSGRFCEEMVDRVLPTSDPNRKNQPRSAIVVLNDYHMLGKRIVYSVMRASGFELFDYGRMDVEQLVERVQVDKLKVLLISVLMLSSALKIREVRDAFDKAGVEIRILVGGAPFLFDSELWQVVGADAMGETASNAIQIVESWMDEIS